MGGKTSTISTSEQRILSLQVQQSSQGLTLPVVYGRARVSGNLIWYGDFTAIEHRTETRQGGKGGGGVKQVDIKYTYEAAIMMALCEGAIKGVTKVWRDKEVFPHISQLRLNLANGGAEQPVWQHLASGKNKNQAISYSDTAYVYSPNYELTNSAQVYNHNFEVDGKLGYSADIVDANPRDILVDLLTNHNYGCGFPAENMGDTGVYSTYCRAAGIFLSPVYSEQSEAQENITRLLEQTNSAAVFSQGRLKVVPYGDSPITGNGAVYTPNLTPLYDLNDDDFLVSGSEDPIKVERKTNADAYNQVQIEFLDRSNDYNIAVAEAKDQANIEQYGLRPQDAIQMHSICDKGVAQQVAQLMLQRALYVRNEYEFKLGWKYVLLEPMDLVTLTDSGLGLDKTPVRIIEIEEDEEGVLTVRAEDFPFGTATATTYPTQPSLGYSANYNVAPGNAHAPVIFEAPLQITNNEPQIWLATAGGDNWGGAEVWVSTDGDSYIRVGTTNRKARYGSTLSALPVGAVYDNVNTVDVEISTGHLDNTTEQDARDLLTACYLDGEFLSYQTAELTGVGRYTLRNLVRGAWGSDSVSHDTGMPFVRIDDALFRYTFDKNWLGKTIWIKLVSFNVFGGAIQELSEVAAYSYRIVGAPLGQVANLRLTSEWTYGRNASLAWNKLDGADSYDIEVYAANSQRRLRVVEGVVDNKFTYTLADMKADGGQVRNVVFKVRGRAVTGKTGAWTQIVAQNPQLKALTGIEIDAGLNQAFFKCATPDEEDFAGIILWVSDDPACPTIDANKVYDGQDTFITINKCADKQLEKGKTYYVRAAGYDSFDKSALNISSSIAFTVYDVSAVAKDLSESNLAKALKNRLDLIDGNGEGSVTARIYQESLERMDAVSAAEKKAADELLQTANELGAEITRTEEKTDNAAKALQQLTAAHDQTAAALQAEQKARAAGDEAEAAARQTLATQVGQNTGRIIQVAQSVSDLEGTVNRKHEELQGEVRGISVGARNLLIDSEFSRPQNWSTAIEVVATVRDDRRLLRVSRKSEGGGSCGVVQAAGGSLSRIRQGETYTLSLNAQGSSGFQASGLNYVHLMRPSAEGVNHRLATMPLTESLNDRPSITFVAPWSSDSMRLLVGALGTFAADDWFEFHSVKLERGSVATDWTPAPEDVDGNIAAVKTYAETQVGLLDSRATKLEQLSASFKALNLFDLDTAESGKYVQETTGNILAGSGHRVSGFIPVRPESDYLWSVIGGDSFNMRVAFYNNAKTYISGRLQSGAATSMNISTKGIANAAFMRVSGSFQTASGYAWEIKPDTRGAEFDAKIETLRQTVAEADGARAQEISTLSASLQNVGGRNLLKGSDVLHQSAAYSRRYELVSAPAVGETITVTLWGELGAGRTGIGVYNSHGYTQLANLVKVADGVYRGTGRWAKPMRDGAEVTPNDTHLNVYFYPNSATSVNTINRIKLERGSIATDWTPAAEDLQGQITETKTAVVDLDGKVSTLYTVKLDANGHAVGFGLSNEIANGRPVGRAIFNVDSFGIGATGASTAFPFTVDTVKKTVGVDGTLVVNGKAIIDKLVTGSINGDKIQTNSLNANRLSAGSITSREIGAGAVTANSLSAGAVTAGKLAAGSVTADKLSVNNLSAISSNLGTINGGHINIGNGNFIVDWGGNVFAKSGRFEGAIYADKIEGDTLKCFRLNRTSTGVYECVIGGAPVERTVVILNIVMQTPDVNQMSSSPGVYGYDTGATLYVNDVSVDSFSRPPLYYEKGSYFVGIRDVFSINLIATLPAWQTIRLRVETVTKRSPVNAYNGNLVAFVSR